MNKLDEKQTVGDMNVPEWEKKLDTEILQRFSNPAQLEFLQDITNAFKPYIRSLLVTQRQELRQQVLEAVGEADADIYPEHDATCECPYHLTLNANQTVRAEIRERIEEIFSESKAGLK